MAYIIEKFPKGKINQVENINKAVKIAIGWCSYSGKSAQIKDSESDAIVFRCKRSIYGLEKSTLQLQNFSPQS